ncbi:uncharacterized protein LOC132723034 [Ruditapes philippinarum]|uniref:uncharacterized protein LOC132723034 n=1 Tax=Ruditapes philippinarum TaxID=129788 RepID=UPI00295BFA85|nr:uncharacterized protein LOC132723034 [Ruditapes philippinarum]
MLCAAALDKQIHSGQPYAVKPMKELDKQNKERECKGCANLKKSLESMDIDQNALVQTTKKLGEEIRQWERKYTTLEKRSNDITAKMAGVLEVSGNLENINDQYSNTKLAKRFEDLYGNQWADLSEWLQENIEHVTELDRIKTLTCLMKLSYYECVSTADSQMRKFLFLDKNDMIPLPVEDPELFRLRRRNGQGVYTRTRVKQTIAKKTLNTAHANIFMETDDKDEVEKKLVEFFEEFIDICWLMTISHPRLLLNFDVVGKPYSGTIKERFKQYSCQDIVTDRSLSCGDILEVVWPSVELENEEGVCAKGDVITVQKGRDNTKAHSDKRRKSTRKIKDCESFKEDTITVQKEKTIIEGFNAKKNITSVGHEGGENCETVHGERNIIAVQEGDVDEFEEISLT